MTKQQLQQFKSQLEEWKKSIEDEIQSEIEIIINHPILEQEHSEEGDLIDAKNIIDFQEKRTQKYMFLLKEINHALKKIEKNSYGVCEETEEPISIERLNANPIARYSIEAQTLLEQKK